MGNSVPTSRNKACILAQKGLADFQKQKTQELKIAPEILKHPIFVWKDDEIISFITTSFQMIISSKPEDKAQERVNSLMRQFAHDLIFEFNKAEDLTKNNASNQYQKMSCGKHLTIGDIYFQCFDCDAEEGREINSLQCVECFEKANHEGHRVILVKKESAGAATCDCGDPNFFKEEGFCPNHQPQKTSAKEILEKFPAILHERYKYVLKKLFYCIICLFDLALSFSNHSFVLKETMMQTANDFLNELLDFCEKSFKEKNGTFRIILGMVLQERFINPYNKLWHYCEDTSGDFIANFSETNSPHNCTCSILGNLLRIGQRMAPELQGKLERILIECITEPNFQDNLTLEWSKYLQCLFTPTFNGTGSLQEDNVNSKLLNMYYQITKKEEVLLENIRLGHFKNLIKVLEKSISTPQELVTEVMHCVEKIRLIIRRYLTKKNTRICEKLLMDLDFTKSLLGIQEGLERKYMYPLPMNINTQVHEIDFLFMIVSFISEKTVNQMLENCIIRICRLPNDQKSFLIKRFMSNWNAFFIDIKPTIDNRFANSIVTFNAGLERVVCSAILSCLGETTTKEKLEDFFKENLPGVEANKAAENISEGILRIFGIIRFIHLIHNFTEGPIHLIYYFLGSTLFEMDILSIQMMAMLIKPENLFEHFVKAFFTYDSSLQMFFHDPLSLSKDDERLKRKITVLQDFLHLIIFLMNDETCYMNVQMRSEELFEEDFDIKDLVQRVNKKIAINFLLGFYWTDLSTMKILLNEVGIVREQPQMDEIMTNITISDEKKHKIRIKDEYQTEYDPYIFYKKPVVQQHISSEFSSKSHINEKVDLVGGKYYKNASEKLKAIQKNFFQSSLPTFLSHFLKVYNKETSPLLRPVLKLILFNLQSVKEALAQNTSEEIESMKKRTLELYGTEEIENIFEKITKEEDFKDCKICIGKIRTLIQKLSSNEHLDDDKDEGEVKEVAKDDEDIKKKMAKERMNKMKEQFAKKQNEFASKNKEIISESENSSPEIQKKHDDGLCCQLCKELINEETDLYGVPVEIAFTNNLYDTQKPVVFKEQNYSDLQKANWWPVISSCNHLYHQNCFNTMAENFRTTLDQTKLLLFPNQSDVCCAICKTYSNNFLLIKNKKEEASLSEEERIRIPGQATQFCGTIMVLFDSMIENIIGNGPKTYIDFTVLFERTYNYFIETFYLQTQESSLQTFVKLYLNAFRTFLNIMSNKMVVPTLYEVLDSRTNLIGKGNESLFAFRSEDILNTIFSIQALSNSSQQQSIIQILKDYLSFKVSQFISLEKHESFLKVEDCFTFYKNNQSFKDAIHTELIFPLQKIVLAHSINSLLRKTSDVSSELITILCNPEENMEYLNKLCQQIDSSFTFEHLLNEAFIEASKDELKSRIINSMLQSKVTQDRIPKPIAIKLAPSFIHIPDNYAEFNSKYMKKACSVCKRHNKNLFITICLICGDVLCGIQCLSETGSLNNHCKKYHMGLGIFMDKVSLAKQAVSSPLNVFYMPNHLYIDKYGQAIENVLTNGNSQYNLRTLDYKSFTVNEDFRKELKDEVLNSSMRKVIVRASVEGSIFNPGAL